MHVLVYVYVFLCSEVCVCECEFACKNHEVQNLKFLVPGLLCKGQLSCSLCLETVIEGKARDFQMLVRSIGTIIPSYAFCHHTVRVHVRVHCVLLFICSLASKKATGV